MDTPKRIAFLGGKKIGFSSLNYLLENKNQLGIELVCVFENTSSKLNPADNTVSSLAFKHGINLHSEIDDLLEYSDIDFILSVQYDKILQANHISKATELAVNLHMAPLPEYRGCNQFSFAIIDEAEVFGTTLHRLEEGIDSGDILFEKRFPIPKECFVTDLYGKTLVASAELFEESIENLLKGNYKLTSQKSLVEKRRAGFHLRSEVNQIKEIDGSWSVEKQKRHFRATWFPPFSPPVLLQGNKPLDLNWYNNLL
ncbi:MAG: formyltransferase family protein [Salibacteraceae bacterium]